MSESYLYRWDADRGVFVGFGATVEGPLAVLFDIEDEKNVLLKHGAVAGVRQMWERMRTEFENLGLAVHHLVVVELPVEPRSADLVNWSVERAGSIHPELREAVAAAAAPFQEKA